MAINSNSLMHDLNNHLQLLFKMIDQLQDVAGSSSLNSLKNYIEKTKKISDQIRATITTALTNTVTNADLVSITDGIRSQCSSAFNVPVSFRHRGYPTALINKGSYYALVTNLIRNSWEAGASEIVVEINEDSLIISDNGPGINETILSFIQNKQTITSKSQGIGRGFALLNDFCMKMGWIAKISNRIDVDGCSIKIQFQIKKDGS
ncbi:MAG: ATP-binding protein [Oligoflexales bacterium]